MPYSPGGQWTFDLWETAPRAPALPFIMAFATVAGATVSAMGAISQGQAASATAGYNEQIEQQRAQQAQEASDAEAGQQQIQTRYQIGQQEAAFGAGGLDVGSGTPLLVMNDTATKGALQAALTQWQGQTQASSDINQGQLDAAQGSAAQTAGYLKAGSTLLTGAGQVGQMYFGSAGTSPFGGSIGSSGFSPGNFPGLSPTMTGSAGGTIIQR